MKAKKKKKTFNVQRLTFNAQRGEETVRVREGPRADFGVAGGGETKFDLEDRLLEFTARLLKLIDALPNTRAGNHTAGQLLRCGTSPFANHGEVQAAESRKDFIYKLGVCFKELKEIKRWLRLVARVDLIPAKRGRLLLQETEELLRIFFSASIRTAEKNSQ